MKYKKYKERHFILFAFKRIFDFTISIIGIIITFIPMLFIAIIIKLTSKGPVFFKQDRIGKNEKNFKMYKFRTMKLDSPNCPPNRFINSSYFITPFGKFLRKSSLDELPQLFNILVGTMSLVGPRPGAAINEDDLRDLRREKNIFFCKPGLTGWAQVNGRDVLALDIEKKTEYDRYYMENISIKLDILCIIYTFKTITKNDGYQEGI